MENFNYYVLYYLTKDRNSYICSNRVELNRPINDMEDLELIKKMKKIRNLIIFKY